MSSQVITRLRCDQEKVGLAWADCPTPVRTSTTHSVAVARAEAKQAGWVRKHHEDGQVDLCPSCAKRATLNPTNKGGRPRKCRACKRAGGPYPNGDRPKSSSPLQSGCPRCGYCL